MTTKHSPGPWTLNGVLVRDAENLPIADAYGRETDPIHKANARLIAAAPELLEACQELADWSQDYGPGSDDDALGDARLVNAVCRARAAIAKGTL